MGKNNDRIDTDQTKDKIKLIMKANGTSDSILYCLINRCENENTIKILIKAF
jgi:hypothetical protein